MQQAYAVPTGPSSDAVMLWVFHHHHRVLLFSQDRWDRCRLRLQRAQDTVSTGLLSTS